MADDELTPCECEDTEPCECDTDKPRRKRTKQAAEAEQPVDADVTDEVAPAVAKHFTPPRRKRLCNCH